MSTMTKQQINDDEWDKRRTHRRIVDQFDRLSDKFEIFFNSYTDWLNNFEPEDTYYTEMSYPFRTKAQIVKVCNALLAEHAWLAMIYPTLTTDQKNAVNYVWDDINRQVDDLRDIQRKLQKTQPRSAKPGRPALTRNRQTGVKSSSFMDRIATVSGITPRRR